MRRVSSRLVKHIMHSSSNRMQITRCPESLFHYCYYCRFSLLQLTLGKRLSGVWKWWVFPSIFGWSASKGTGQASQKLCLKREQLQHFAFICFKLLVPSQKDISCSKVQLIFALGNSSLLFLEPAYFTLGQSSWFFFSDVLYWGMHDCCITKQRISICFLQLPLTSSE